MVEALAFVHSKKVIHRDLKPSNIFMTKDLDISLGARGVALLTARGLWRGDCYERRAHTDAHNCWYVIAE